MRRTVTFLCVLVLLVAARDASAQVGLYLHRALIAAGVPVVGVSIGDAANKATWTVQPADLQDEAQPIIDAFNASNPAHETAELTARVTAALDSERLTSAVVWTILKQMYPMDTDAQTKTKYGVARTRIINAYKTRPWAQ